MTDQWTRRQFLRRALAGVVGLSGVFLAACGGGSSATTGASTVGGAAATTHDQMDMSGMTMTTSGAPAPTAEAQPSPPATPSGSDAPVASPISQGGNATQAQMDVKIVEPSLNYQTWTYEPNDLHVAVGTMVIWTNTGGAAHTVTADDGTSFDSGPISPEKQFSRVMDTTGTYPYHCSFHPYMKGTVTVTK